MAGLSETVLWLSKNVVQPRLKTAPPWPSESSVTNTPPVPPVAWLALNVLWLTLRKAGPSMPSLARAPPLAMPPPAPSPPSPPTAWLPVNVLWLTVSVASMVVDAAARALAAGDAGAAVAADHLVVAEHTVGDGEQSAGRVEDAAAPGVAALAAEGLVGRQGAVGDGQGAGVVDPAPVFGLAVGDRQAVQDGGDAGADLEDPAGWPCR